MLKKTIIIAAVLACVVSAAAQTTARNLWIDAGVRFDYRPSWQVFELPEHMLVATFDPFENRPPQAAWGPDDMEMEMRHVITPYPSLRTWVDAAKPLLNGAEVIDRGQVTLPSGFPAVQLDLIPGAGLEVTNYYADIGGQQIFITYTGSDASAAVVLRSLRPLASNPPLATPVDAPPPEVDQELAYQPFEGGFTVYFYGDGDIWAFYDNSTAAFFPPEQYGSLPPNPVTDRPPRRLHRPILGFGKVWGHFPDVRNQLGWATAPEETYWSSVRYTGPDGGVFRTVFTLPDGQTVELSTGRGTYWQVIE